MAFSGIGRALAACVFVTALASASQADVLGTGSGETNKVVLPGETFVNPLFPYAPGPILPELCAVFPEGSCQEHLLTIGDVGTNDVAIALGWSTEAEQIDLYVYDPDDQPIAAATGFTSEGRSVLLHAPAPGTYRILLAGSRIEEESYRLIAQIQTPIGSPPLVDLLPSLVTPPPKDFHVNGLPVIPSTSVGFAIPQELIPFELEESCYVDEVGGDPREHRCLRFTNDVVNVGAGPLEIEFRLAPNEDLCEVRQVIYKSDGSAEHETIEGGCELHPTHGHFHFLGLAGYELFAFDENAEGFRGARVGTGSKVGFCLADGDPEAANNHTGLADDSTVLPIQPQTYRFPNCNFPVRASDGLWSVMGISSGWGDVYTWDLPDQYIEITELPPGAHKYEVVSTADPDGVLMRDPSNVNRSGSQWICLTDDSVQSLAGPLADCP